MCERYAVSCISSDIQELLDELCAATEVGEGVAVAAIVSARRVPGSVVITDKTEVWHVSENYFCLIAETQLFGGVLLKIHIIREFENEGYACY